MKSDRTIAYLAFFLALLALVMHAF
jgi:hypothetical protein